jgi:hypothetical protein
MSSISEKARELGVALGVKFNGEQTIAEVISAISKHFGGGTSQTIAGSFEELSKVSGSIGPNPLSALTVDADISDSVDLLGKVASDLQSDIAITDGVVTGTLKYVEGYTGWSTDPAEQEGNYIALHFAVADVTGASIYVRFPSGSNKKYLVDPADGLVVSRITEAHLAGGLEVTVTHEDYADFVTMLDISNLTLTPKA